MTVLVTGATGLLGSNVCAMLLARGRGVRAIARRLDALDARSLRDAGVEVVSGDVQDLESLRKAAAGVEGVIHSAAMLGRPGATMEVGFPTNVIGTLNVLSVAAEVGAPVVQVLTTTFFDPGKGAFSEHAPLDLKFQNKDVYSVTKRLGYVEGVARVQSGQDIRFMIPGAIYGPSICLEKGLEPNNFNDRIVKAVKGEMPPQLPLPMPWVTGEDCAFVCVEALDKGVKGERYIAHGVPEEAGTVAEIGNMACEMAGVPHRVKQYTKDELDSPELFKIFGPTIPLLARNASARPPADTRFTQEKLGYRPTPLAQGLRLTLDWMRGLGSV
jgi:nucleoside-diphosphate-sugar epimerase